MSQAACWRGRMAKRAARDWGVSRWSSVQTPFSNCQQMPSGNSKALDSSRSWLTARQALVMSGIWWMGDPFVEHREHHLGLSCFEPTDHRRWSLQVPFQGQWFSSSERSPTPQRAARPPPPPSVHACCRERWQSWSRPPCPLPAWSPSQPRYT